MKNQKVKRIKMTLIKKMENLRKMHPQKIMMRRSQKMKELVMKLQRKRRRKIRKSD